MGGLKYFTRRLLVASILTSGCSLYAQSGAEDREVQKRAAASQNASELLVQGDASYREGDFKAAVDHYRNAVGALPRQAGAAAELRAAAVQRFSQASVEQARILARTGDYATANDLLDAVDAETIDAGNPHVEQLRDKLDDPIRTNPALTKEHSANVDKVRRLLYEAQGFMDLGQFDRSQMTYEDVLRVDPYNKAARRGMERVNWYRSDYTDAARDQTKAKLMADVESQWENLDHQEAPPEIGAGLLSNGGMVAVSTPLLKLRSINVPVVDMQDTTIFEAIDYLKSISVQNDTTNLDGVPKGIDFIVQLGSEDHPLVQQIRNARINLQVNNVPLEQVLKMVTEATRTQYRVDEFAIVIRPLGATDQSLIRREFRVPPDFLTSSAIGGQGDTDDPFAEPSAGGSLLARRLTALEKLKSMGVTFPEGSSANYNSSTSTLVVRNTTDNLDLVSQIASALAETEPVNVIVRTSIIEVTNENLQELGYDQILNAINVGGGVYLAGGSVGSGSDLADMISGSPVTSGNRSGSEAVTVEGLDSLLTRKPPTLPAGRLTGGSAGLSSTSTLIIPPAGGGGENRAPGAISVQGIISGSLHQILLRGFSQKKGVDLMTRPEVITRSGQNAVIKSVRELFYPDEYEPPELPNSVGSTDFVDLVTGEGASASGAVPIVPSTPTSFLQTELGVTLEVVPTVSADRRTIEVSVKPRVRDLLGFVNYGTPIIGSNSSVVSNLAGGGAGGDSFTTTTDVGEVTPNAILKPLIRSIEANTTVTIADGQAIVIGGQVRETVQKFEDGTPVLKNLPLIGRFFRSEGLSTIKKNLIILVQVELVDPAGKTYRNR
ncbi:MAG: Amuc_1098 family type IV pilus outer membrane protein [Verrucomicrobiaceae bacterium]